MKTNRIVILLLLSNFLLSCGKVLNSSSNDAALAQGTAEFLSAKQVLYDKCMSCHSNWSSYSEADFINDHLITKYSPNTSTLYLKIKGNDSGQTGDMPPTGAALGYSELTAIKTWINSN